MPAAGTMTAQRARGARGRGSLAAGLPAGRRTPRGRSRWYLVEVPEGREELYCERVRRLVPAGALDDAFCIYKERWMKREGRWFTRELLMYRGLFFAVTRDAAALDGALQRLTFPARLMGSEGRSWVPLADEARDWLSAAMDGRHVIRSSTAVIVDGVLHVQEGPLVGQEASMARLDRHKRCCEVHVCDADGGFVERMPLDIPFKS